MPKFYITTPVYYVNASPHIGHAYSTIVADVLARQHRMLGDDVFFLTGTDEHGQKIERAAVAAGKTPLEFATENYQKFLMLAGRLNTTMDAFIRTTDDFHIKGVQHLFNVLYEKGYIYLDSYTGVYCVSDESYVDVKAGEPCPECGRKTETVTEENFFFKLTAFTEKVSKLILEDDLLIEPDSRRLEVLNILEKTTRDLSISRSSFTWGIPVPEPAASLTEKKHVVYVWLDALANYMTAVGYGDMDEENAAMFSKWWPADLHVIGKEITRFHCIYWPAFLLAADLPLPKTVNAHGWLLFDKEKMSKSKGNVVSADVVLDAFAGLWEKQYPLSKVRSRDDFAADVLRYYLLREIPFGHDGNFSTDALISRYNSDLANGFGNLISRTFSMIQKFLGGKVPVHRDDGLTFKQWEPLQSSDFATDLTELQRVVQLADRKLSAAEPWKLAKLEDDESKQLLQAVLRSALDAIQQVTVQLHPYLPYTTGLVYNYFGVGSIADYRTVTRWCEYLAIGHANIPPIFPRATGVVIEQGDV